MGFELESLYQAMTFALIDLVAGNEQERCVDVGTRGDAARIRVLESTGEVMMTVYGTGSSEVGEQLVLSCLKKISVQRLGELHKAPLKKAAPLTLAKG
ncbi:hypothetical protein KP005_17925 [Geomonas nitrogeniifigens]|uniref:Uncharacterized protein n=1 Tax=Geomonas diazotrophica TaxID=2843197 RepID=A0ABX8JKL5_9BACT|nr:hypothetical protein [Geomonas nitrogeniifigens]QWV97197.1 hypothetical protein KP005_17925 [Geomonas nitrogeniifigens]